jgi:site-specific DNA-methyltransferase (adenine-specific)
VTETKAAYSMRTRNPDVLSCIANLSNDEVFTPPEFANQMLNTLAEGWASANDGADIWGDSSVTFLDPFTKSGVFLREITKRLVDGLADEMPDLQERVDHILTKQVFGIGITEICAYLARRSLYCSKDATGEHSIAKSFDDADGNIWFQRTEHSWADGTKWVYTADQDGNQVKKFTDGKCRFCGASQSTLDRGVDAESHAYAFIHTDNVAARVAEIFGAEVQFDVIIGNPPYQLQSDGGTRDMPIYQKFVEQAKRLEPRLLTMVIPSRWMASGLGLNEFRKEMLNDRRVQSLVDFPAASEVFPGVEIKAGVCYFLWDANYDGDCEVTMTRGDERVGPLPRNLGEYDVFVRDSRAVQILHKLSAFSEPSINEILARDKEFGWTSNFRGFHETQKPGDIPLNYIQTMKRGVGYINRKEVKKSAHLIDTWKVLVPEAFNGGDAMPHQIVGKPLLAPSPSVCTQSFLFFYVDTEEEAQSIKSYYTTRFFRFLVSLRKITQHATHATYTWVPQQTWDRTWTDEALYEKYGITDEEQKFVESMVRALEVA